MKENSKRTIPGFGMRTTKTAIAVTVSFILITLLNQSHILISPALNFLGALQACTAAVICMETSVAQSIKSGISLFIGTFIGAGFGCLVLLLSFQLNSDWALTLLDTVKIFLGIMLSIAACNIVKQASASTMSCIVFNIVVLSPPPDGQNPYLGAVSRIVETALGIIVAVAVNHFFNNRKKDKQ